MMKYLPLILVLFTTVASFSQSIIQEQLNANDVRLAAQNNGILFRSNPNYNFIYEVPASIGTSIIELGLFWFGGVSQDETVYVSAAKRTSDISFINGPIADQMYYNLPEYQSVYGESIWKVNKEEIQFHIDNYNQSWYEAPKGIKGWPGTGMEEIGVASQLAPYVDVNNDGIYNPNDGDYPCIKGDEAIYMIFNDDRVSDFFEPSENRGLGMEYHVMVYQFEDTNYINQTTFIELQVINRSLNDYSNFKPALFIDANIDFPFSDYIGCDSTHNVGYTYNATNTDEGVYGENLPALGVVCLDRNMEYFGTFSFLSSSNPNAVPLYNPDYWNYMNGKWKDGSNWLYGGNGVPGSQGVTNEPTSFLYSGNPLTGEGWSELNIDGNGLAAPSDESRRKFIVPEHQFLASGESAYYNFSILFSNDGNHLEDVQNIIELAQDVKLHYDQNISNSSCNVSGTGIVGTPIVDSILPQQMFEITRLDGKGNMGLTERISVETEQEILENNSVGKVNYERSFGPVNAYIYDTINHVLGYIQLKVLDASNLGDASWVAYLYDIEGGELLDSVNATTSLFEGDTYFIEDWGIAIQLVQSTYFCASGTENCPQRELEAPAISSELSFEENSTPWLTGIKDNHSFSEMNWISKQSSYEISENEDAACFSDPFFPLKIAKFRELCEGIIVPSKYTRVTNCDFAMPVLDVGQNNAISNFHIINIRQNFNSTFMAPNIDIVFTPDQSKWTRCPVIELNKDGSGIPGGLKMNPSVDKNGQEDNSETYGLSWFPGYAIDVETGRRLNMAFGENSKFMDDNGDDMVWNPTDRIVDENGYFVLGGQHVIYVFGGDFDDMPNYDEGAFLHEKLMQENGTAFATVYKNLSWVMQPLKEVNQSLLSSPARLSVRLDKAFSNYELTGLNQGNPMFGWDILPYQVVNSQEISVNNELFMYPNPSSQEVRIIWSENNINEIIIMNANGQLVSQIAVEPNSNEAVIDVSGLSAGIHFVKVGIMTKKLLKQ